MPSDDQTCSDPKLPDAPTPDDIFPDNEILRDAAWAGFYGMCNDLRLCTLHRVNAAIKYQHAISEAADAVRTARWQIESAREELERLAARLEKKNRDDRDGQG